MKRSERIISTFFLVVIVLPNLLAPVSYAARPESTAASSSATFHSGAPSPAPRFPLPEQGSVLGASTSLLKVGAQGVDTQASASKRVPIRMQQLPKRVYQTNENVALAVSNPDNDPFSTAVVNAKGQGINAPITETNDGTTTNVQIAGSNEITPGQYTIRVTDESGDVTTQDFTWGVLALNPDKSMYHPGDTADLSMAVLNDQGDMVCDASLTLKITNVAGGGTDILSTTSASGSAQIVVNPQCQQHDFSLQPDYQAAYQFKNAGTYSLQLTAVTQNGTHTITDTVPVTNNIAFDVQRVSATRVYPPNTYPMTVKIKANRDFSGTVTETVPEDFVVTPATMSATPVASYTNMQTVYLNSTDPAAQLQQAINASGSGGLVMPFHGYYPITQGFGVQMTDPTLQAFYTQYGLAGHDGVDFGVPMNTSLYAVDDGNIIWSGPGDYGTTIIIQHGWGESYYGHLSSTAVTVGTHVTKGQLIGYSGESGEATGPHLHFGIKPLNPDMTNGYYGKVDPLPYLPYSNQQPQELSTLNPTLAQTVLAASTSATPQPTEEPSPDASGSAAISIPPSAAPTILPTEALATPTQAISESPATTLSPTQGVQQTTITESPTPPSNTNFTVLDKQILLSEELASSDQTERVKVLTWNITLKKGENTSIGYDYQTPRTSPQFYLLGPIQFYQNGSNKVVFQEQRQWELASDDVGVEWYNNNTGNTWNGYSWAYRKKITISSTMVSGGSSLTNFPVEISLPSDTDLGAHAPSGNDILFTDSTGETLLPFEIESYSVTSGAATLVAWVNISSLSSSSNTIIYMYYGNPAATSQANVNGTWNSNFKAVYHLGENTTNKTITDSTIDGYNGTANQNTNGTHTASGEIDGAQSLNGTSDKIDITNRTNLNFGAGSFTFFVWVNEPAPSNSPVIFWNGGAGASEQGYDLEDDSGVWKFHLSDGSNYPTGLINTVYSSWKNLAYVVDRSGGHVIPYLNGAAQTSASLGALGSTTNVTRDTTIGTYPPSPTGLYYTGKIDELEISNGALTPGWITTEYNNQNNPSGFETVGGVETDAYAPTLGQLLRHGEFFGTQGVESGVRQPFTF
jgi:murein DD-endopeptidase MepM/ murein hydrolase activator NlpD